MSQQPSWIGQTLSDRYVIEEQLGQGGMSTVFKGTDPNLRRVVAIKLIHPHLSSNPDFVRRFEEEAAAVASLSHPNIIQVFDFNSDNDVYYMVLEFLAGETLKDRLTRVTAAGRKMDFEEVVNVGAGISDALDYAHKRGMVHRDIKPANIMLTPQGKPVLMDFGVVRIMGGQQHTATGAVIGTALYMSPEQVRGERPDERADIYSMGVTLYEMVSGHPPYEADSAMATMMMHVNDPVPNIREVNPDTPAGLKAVIEKALAKRKEDRYQSAADLAAALREALSMPEPEEPTFDATFIEDTSAQVPQNIEGTLIESAPPPVAQPTAVPAPAAATAQKSATTARQVEPSGGGRSGMPLALIGGGAVVALIICVIVGVLVVPGLLGGGTGGQADATEEPVVVDATEEPVAVEATEEPVAAPTEAPTDIPTEEPTPEPTQPEGPFVQIMDITVENSTYIVGYITYGYEPALPGMHVHFFYDTVPPEQAGVPGSGAWFVYGGPSPFTGYATGSRPADAQQMCALVANPDHTVIPQSGNCWYLP